MRSEVDFFESGENGCHILDNEDGVLFVRKPDGRATGDAFVLFSSEEDSTKALGKHREIIGSRYIELFRSTTAEVQQVLNRSMDPRTYEQQQPLIAQLPQLPLLPQQIITSGTRKDCIRLRGLPFEAQVEHILEFLGELAKSIVYQGVHMVYNAHGQPSGEAFIQMDSEHSAFLASQQRHHRYMVFGKKQRYIEVFQCSGEDMNMVLTGGLPAQRPILSPGMLVWDGASPLPSPLGPHPPSLPPPHGAPRPQGPPPFPGLAHPFPPPPHHHGPIIPGLPPTSLKQPETPLLLPPPPMGHPPPRQQLALPPPIEMPHTSQTPQTLLTTVKPTMSTIPPGLLGHYGDLAVASQLGAHTNPVFFFSNPRTPLSSGLHHQVTLVPVSSAQGRDTQATHTVQKPPMGPPLLPMPYAAATSIAGARVSATQKRSFEQAFPGDTGAAGMGALKRTTLIRTSESCTSEQIVGWQCGGGGGVVVELPPSGNTCSEPTAGSGGTVLAPPFGAFPLGPAPPVLNAVGAVTPRLPAYPGMAYPTMFYWPYPSPPVSPSSAYYGSPPPLAAPPTPPHHTILAPECLPIQANGDATRHNGEVVATM
ncbi:hypothetical protein Pcinc_006610 [Petrolisthes cinctipes]|uniref:RRM domain-containing protein n=1 Tax=Petrolisthes cinctipes TaxID=88211 RepID=A0AAE1GCP5_PETCI|nr:hypothetical protein Pcinc_006610 [Petrolisthes cinctipes]